MRIRLLPLLCAAAGAAALPAQKPEDGRGRSLFGPEWHAARRQALMEVVKDGVIVLRGAPTQDDYREFRQDNNFWYLSGVSTPNAVLVLLPETGEEVLFVPPVNPLMETWVGDLTDPGEARELTGIEDCRPLGDQPGGMGGFDASHLEEFLDGLARKYKTFYTQGQPAENWMMSRDQLQTALREQLQDPYDGRPGREQQFMKRLQELHGVEVKDLTVTLDALRIRKTPEEVAAMRRAAEISGLGHLAAIAEGHAGMYEWELNAIMTGTFLRHGAMGPAYMAIIGSGPNSIILHYSANDRQLQEGDVVLIDYGAEYQHYVADVTRTWPVGPRFTDRQREVYQAVYDAQEAAFRQCVPGSRINKVHAAAARVLRERGLARYFNHGTSHWLGMATHDVGAPLARFQPGMVITVEPGVYIPEEGFGIRIEDIVLVTEDGPELLTAGIPRRLEEIEALRARALGVEPATGAGP